jgi:hypothetical protein
MTATWSVCQEGGLNTLTLKVSSSLRFDNTHQSSTMFTSSLHAICTFVSLDIDTSTTLLTTEILHKPL